MPRVHVVLTTPPWLWGRAHALQPASPRDRFEPPRLARAGFRRQAVRSSIARLQRSSTPMAEPSGSTAPRPNRLRRQTPYPIAALPAELTSGQELLLLCGPEQGGWRLGSWREGAWRDANDPFAQLRPTHFALASGWRQENGQWGRSSSGWIALLGICGVVLAGIAALALAPELGRDLWALCTSIAVGTESLAPSLGR